MLFEKTRDDAPIPARKYRGDAGYDLTCLERATFQPGQTQRIKHGVRLHLPSGWWALVTDRSSVALQGFTTHGGVIDETYEAEISTIMRNGTKLTLSIEPGTRVSQLVLIPRYVDEAEADLPLRGRNGFGSTGR